VAGAASLDALISAAAPDLAPAPAGADDDCFWLYSSGSTGTPKGTVHAHRSMALTSQLYGVDTLGFGEEDSSFSASKLFFAYGLGNAMTFPLWVGGSCVLEPGRPTPGGIFDAIERFQPSHFFGVPTLYAALLAALEPTSRTSARCGPVYRPARRFRRISCAAGKKQPGCRSTKASAPPRPSTSSFRAGPMR